MKGGWIMSEKKLRNITDVLCFLMILGYVMYLGYLGKSAGEGADPF